MSEDRILFDFSYDGRYSFQTSIETAIEKAQNELTLIRESVDSVSQLRPQCDRLVYILAACSGVLTGLMDVFLVGKPKESKFGTVTDKWFEEREKAYIDFLYLHNQFDRCERTILL